MNGTRVDAAGLSPRGLERRGEILRRMQRAGAWRSRKRAALRGGLAGIPAAAVIAAVVIATIHPAPPVVSPGPAAPIAEGSPAGGGRAAGGGDRAAPVESAAPAFRLVRYEVVGTAPGVLERWTAPAGGGGGIAIIGDRELSLELGLAGLDPGVIRAGERVIVSAADRLERPAP